MTDPAEFLEQLYREVQDNPEKSLISDTEIQAKIEFVCRCLTNKAPIRFLMACLLGKLDDPNVDIRKPYTEIGGKDSFSGRRYDEQFVEPFVIKYKLPTNSTTAFLTPAFRNIDRKLTTDRTIAIEKLGAFQKEKDKWIPLVKQRLSDEDASVRKAAVARLTELGESSVAPEIVRLLRDPSDEVRREVLKALRVLGDQSTAGDVLTHALEEEDPELKVELLGTAVALGESKAISPLIGLAEAGGLFGSDAIEELKAHFEPNLVPDDPGKMKKWWEAIRHRLQYDPATKLFGVR